MTNIERIRRMSEQELSKFLYSVYLSCCICCNCHGNCKPEDSCREKMKEWLMTEIQAPQSKWDNDMIIKLGLSPKVFQILTEAGITTIGKLMGYTAYDLSKIPYLGEQSIREIENRLFELTGNSLKMP